MRRWLTWIRFTALLICASPLCWGRTGTLAPRRLRPMQRTARPAVARVLLAVLLGLSVGTLASPSRRSYGAPNTLQFVVPSDQALRQQADARRDQGTTLIRQ